MIKTPILDLENQIFFSVSLLKNIYLQIASTHHDTVQPLLSKCKMVQVHLVEMI